MQRATVLKHFILYLVKKIYLFLVWFISKFCLIVTNYELCTYTQFYSNFFGICHGQNCTFFNKIYKVNCCATDGKNKNKQCLVTTKNEAETPIVVSFIFLQI